MLGQSYYLQKFCDSRNPISRRFWSFTATTWTSFCCITDRRRRRPSRRTSPRKNSTLSVKIFFWKWHLHLSFYPFNLFTYILRSYTCLPSDGGARLHYHYLLHSKSAIAHQLFGLVPFLPPKNRDGGNHLNFAIRVTTRNWTWAICTAK